MLHDFYWALTKLKTGERVRRASWFKFCSVFRGKENKITVCQGPGNYHEWKPSSEDLFAVDWEEGNKC